MFDTYQHREFNDDWPVICHELGHAITWFHFGEGIGRLKWCRCNGSPLRAGVALWPRTGGLEELLSPEYAQPYAERLLAGELAARRALGHLRTDQVCSKGLPVDAGIACLADTLARIDPMSDLAKEDVVKVLTLAINNAQSNWCAWFGERLRRADALVSQNWDAIDQIAQRLKRHLPVPGKFRVWAGFEIIGQMRRSGIQSDKHTPVEIVFNGYNGGFLTRLRRCMQEAGPNGIACRYVDVPKE